MDGWKVLEIDGKWLRMREKYIERKLVKAVKARGGIAPKFVSPGLDGMPDRIILMPDGKCGFAELKAPGEEPRPLQSKRLMRLSELGFKVFVVDGVEQIGAVIDEIQST